MQLIQVQSSNIQAIGFKEGEQISLGRKESNILRIQFTSGVSYDYFDIPKEVFNDFLKADSKGKYYHIVIKDKYLFEKVK